jgi:ribosomal protein S12 methylthiotransferase accessory factor
VLSANRDSVENIDTIEDVEFLRWLKTSKIANQLYLVPDESASARTASGYAMRWTDDLKDDVLLCQELTAQHGMEMLVLDQTRPDIGLSVVKVVVPGLRHFWPRFARGRLYEIPAALGWVPEPVAEDGLNPISMFI